MLVPSRLVILRNLLVRPVVAASLLLLASSCGEGGADAGASDESTPEAEPTKRASGTEADAGGTSDTTAGPPEGDATVVDESGERAPRWQSATGDDLFETGEVLTFELTLDQEAFAFLDADPAAEEYVVGAVTFDGETLDPVGIRYKGSVGSFFGCTDGPNPFEPSGAKTCDKLSIKVKTNWDDKDLEFYGQRRLQFHALNSDPSMMRDLLGYRMFRDMGVPASRTTPVRLVINGEYAGLYMMVEQVDGRFVRDRFDDGTGNLYKGVWPLDDGQRPNETAVLVAALRTNEDEADTSIMETFAAAVGALRPGDADAAREVLSTWTDLDALMAYTVVDRTLKHDDGPFHWFCRRDGCSPKNYYWYEEPASGRVHLVPWDLDNAMLDPESPKNRILGISDAWGEVSNDCEPPPPGMGAQLSAACDPLVAAMVLLDDEYERIEQEFLEGPFAATNVDGLIAEWIELLAPHVAEQAAELDGVPSVDEWEAAVSQLRIIVDDLHRAAAG